MTGLRTYTTLDPNIWRFPQWKENVYYPASSFVAVPVYNPLDSDQITFAYYVSIEDVPTNHVEIGAPVYRKGELMPTDSDSDWVNHTSLATNPWALAFDTTADVLNADIIAKVEALTPLLAILGIDSDLAILFRNDSDFKVKDSEQDSDILQAYHDAWAWDSDRDSEAYRRDDSDRHDFQAADSDILEMLVRLDSELDSEIHDRRAADSDILEMLVRLDSELDSEIHDRAAADSDIIEWLKSTDSDLDSESLLLHTRLDSDSDRLTNFIHRYEERDSDIQTVLDDHDSDISWLYQNGGLGSTALGNTGFPVGTILQFASEEMPTGFLPCDGRTFDPLSFPDLLAMLGSNRVPDLRNQFLRGWNNDSDGFGNNRPLLSYQEDQFESHSHQYSRFNMPGGGDHNQAARRENNDGLLSTQNTFSNPGGDETRPVNVSVVFGISLYNGAGIIYDSEVIESILRMRLRDYDSDLIALYSRTNYREDAIEPALDLPIGSTYDIGETISNYDDIEVMLNGINVRQYTTSGSVFTFNFIIRGNIDVVTIKLRR